MLGSQFSFEKLAGGGGINRVQKERIARMPRRETKDRILECISKRVPSCDEALIAHIKKYTFLLIDIENI
jgi:hypothetical protein